MPYTPPSQRSPAASASTSPVISRRSSYQTAGQSKDSTTSPPRPELPRSASYLTRHRRTPSVKTASFASTRETSEPTPPGTADSETTDDNSFGTHGSIRQSPPPASDDVMPRGAIMSPPDSTSNSSDDDEELVDLGRGRQLDNLAELAAAISVIEQTREGSPDRSPTATDAAKDEESLKENLSLIMPAQTADVSPSSTNHVTPVQETRKISHVRSSTEGCGFFDMLKKSSVVSSRSPSDSDEGSDGELMIRPQMVRKKSGELVRPALRATSARRRPSSMPGTPTFGGKAVHFDSHLEHVRHFLQVDRPLAVSAGSSPVESQYESDNEFPFGDNASSKSRTPPYEWEIVVANFPAETPERLRLPVRVERVFLSADNKMLVGSVAVANIAFNKSVAARFTLDYWKTTSEVIAEYNNDVRRKQVADGYDRFNFNIKLADQANLEAKTMFFCVKYSVNGQEFWDNNDNTNFQIDFKKKAKPQNGKRGMQGAASRPANSLPRSNKKSPPTTTGNTHSVPATFDDFGSGFDSNYDFANFGQPVHDYLGESPTTPVRLKGVKSAVSISSDNLTRRAPSSHAQAFGNRYDFGASLSAAIQSANSAVGERSGLSQNTLANSSLKNKAEKATSSTANSRSNKAAVSANQTNSVRGRNQAAKSSNGTDAPRTDGSEKHQLASQSYHELLDKYCFFGSAKSSPQLLDGTLRGRSGQYDGNDESYIHESRSATPSPTMQTPLKSTERYSPPQQSPKSARSGSPAPMTGFVTGMSPVYPYSMQSSFPFTEAHAATAIRG